ncbi:MAG: U32 family peptidase [Bacteroidetes bacterium]|nr:U32 family peptidase [Bacteroidota bacterium]
MELLLPAGSFQSGIRALENGADALYLGLQNFSARKSAKNFTFEELRRLKTFAVDNRKKIYITCNTVLREQELPDLYKLLDQIAYIEADSIIVQDLGVLATVKEEYPNLTIHASTQLAAHNVSGIKMLEDLGVKRAVLSRELTIEEIGFIRKSCPGMELEVFIHGALCYAYSGLCLASGMLLGRSANRGECGQICRTWFTADIQDTSTEAEPEHTASRNGYFFSMKDLSLKTRVTALEEIGVTAAKVEGRMKSPEYTAQAASFYRSLMRNQPAEDSNLRTVFSRSTTPGWSGKRGSKQSPVSPDYPGHRGIPIGQVIKYNRRENSVDIQLVNTISLRDGILSLKDKGHGHRSQLPEPVKFSVTKLHDLNGNRLVDAKSGMKVRLSVPEYLPDNTLLYKISAHDQKLPEVNPGSLSLWKHPVNHIITLFDEHINISGTITGLGITKEITESITIDTARKPANLQEVLEKIFSASGEGLFINGSITVINKTGRPDEELFLPSSQLKSVRRAWYSGLNTVWENRVSSEKKKQDDHTLTAAAPLPDRKYIVPIKDSPVPFIINPDQYSPENLPQVEGIYYIPLNPVLFDDQTYFNKLDSLLEKFSAITPKTAIRIGLNNIGHLFWAQKHPEFEYFADYYLYCANSRTPGLLQSNLKLVSSAYYWLEDKDQTIHFNTGNIFPVGTGFSPPLFISRSCFRRDSLGITKGCINRAFCDADPIEREKNSICTRFPDPYSLYQTGKNYMVYVKNCITYLFPESQESI